MNQPIDQAGTEPAYAMPARRGRRRLGTLFALAALLGGLVTLTPFAAATASQPSGACADQSDSPTIPLVDGTNNLGLPLWLSIESGATSGAPGHVALCYATASPDDAKLIGGTAWVDVDPSSTYPVEYGHASDTNGAATANAAGDLGATYTFNPGGSNGGQELTVYIPFHLCTGNVCYPPGTVHGNEVGTTGVVVGTIEQTPAGTNGTSAAYRVTGVCITIDGVSVGGLCGADFDHAGITTTGTNPVTGDPATPGPCVVTVCAPSYNYVGTTGNQIGTIHVPIFGPIPVYGVHTCLYRDNASVECPA
ncbi:MAG TPA: hypothetical protein VF230_19330 [Acidimicrobiales bacterium]